MKTHDFAKALTQLGKMLRAMPNQNLADLNLGASPADSLEDNSVGLSLSVLAGLSKFGKSDWERVVIDFDLPIEIRPRDAARDVMGKILNYLAENDDERERVAQRSVVSPSGKPSELSSALRFLLSNG